MNIDRLGQELLATHADAIVAVDGGGIVRFWNPGAARIFGFVADEAVGLSLDLIIPGNLRDRHNTGFAKVMATGATRYGAGDLLAVPAITKDGRRISIEFTIVLLRDDHGHIDGVAAIIRDVSARFEETRSLRRRIAAAEASNSNDVEG